MFKKLREKVGAESPETDGSVSPGMRRASMPLSGHHRSSQRNLHKTESSTSLSSVEEYSATMSKEDLLSALMQRTTQVKRLEIKLADYGQSIKDMKKERDKLTVILEKQQDAALKRMAELEQTYADGKSKRKKAISALEKRETELNELVEELEAENKKLHESVDRWENEKDDFVKKRDEFFAKRENSEELQDLQMQEMAKLKHMLMRSEKDAESRRDELDHKVGELLQCQDTNDELESSLRATTDSLNLTREQLEMQIQRNEKQSAKLKLMSDLKTQNLELTQKIESLNSDMKKTQTALSALEFSHTEVSEKYESLKHSSESLMKNATMDLDEKESTIELLKNKISSLEQRITTDSLPENEQVQALNLERTSLENRLEESHLQLTNIKSTWSMKINQLEEQVSHLNAKIAEDSAESFDKSKKISQLEASNAETIERLTKKLSETEKDIDKSTEQNDNYLKQVTKLEAEIIELTAKYDLDRSNLNSTIDEAKNKAKALETRLREEIKELKKSGEENKTMYENKIKELEADISKREGENDNIAKLLEEAQRSCDTLKEKWENLNETHGQLETKLQETKEKLSTSDKESAELKKQLLTSENKFEDISGKFERTNSALEKVTSELGSLQHEMEEKKKELSESKEGFQSKELQIQEMNERIDEFHVSLESREEELMNCKEEIATLRNSQTEENDEVATLKAEKDKFEERITERERTIKVQQQRLNDLKKALNKELNKKSTGAAGASTRTASPARYTQHNGTDGPTGINGSQEVAPDMSAIGTMSIDDPNSSAEQREVNAKYLKHVILTFLGSSQSEAHQLIKAMSMLLSFNKDEEKFVKDTLEYRGSWFGSKPSTKKVVPSFVKHSKR